MRRYGLELTIEEEKEKKKISEQKTLLSNHLAIKCIANLLKTVHTWNWAGVIFSFVFLLGRCHGVRSLFRKLNTALKLENAKAKNT